MMVSIQKFRLIVLVSNTEVTIRLTSKFRMFAQHYLCRMTTKFKKTSGNMRVVNKFIRNIHTTDTANEKQTCYLLESGLGLESGLKSIFAGLGLGLGF